MKMKYFFLVLLMPVTLVSFGQKKNTAYKFHSINNISLINGDKGAFAGLQSINGFPSLSYRYIPSALLTSNPSGVEEVCAT